MKRRFVWDKDLASIVEITEGSNRSDLGDFEKGQSAAVISDIEPYRAIASDVASANKRPIIGSRSRHREFLRDNRYVEVGNSAPISGSRETLTQRDRVSDIKRAMGE